MEFKILFLLLGGLSIATTASVYEIEKDLKWFLANGSGNPIDSNRHHLQILNKSLGSSDYSLVWKGIFDGQEVAIKISTNQSYVTHEIALYVAANARYYEDIESKGIPRIYYVGHIIFKNRHPVIVMTLFDETLNDRWIKQNKSFNAYSTLEVFLQMVKILSYLQIRGVVHNAIDPKYIYFRGGKVFLAGFRYATFNGTVASCGSRLFGSSRFWNGITALTFSDDLQLLIFTIWYIERIRYNEPAGLTLTRNIIVVKRFIEEKCEHFKNFPLSMKALRFICYDEILSGKSNPDYEGIIKHLTEAIDEVKRKTGQKGFEWLDSTSSASSASSALSLSFENPGEDRPDGTSNPDWLFSP